MLSILILVMIVVFVVVVALFGLLKNHQEKSNRYIKKRKQFSEPDHHELQDKNETVLGKKLEDTNEILGLKESIIEPLKQSNDIPSLIILHLKSDQNYPYGGYDLLQALLSVGLRYGKMNIFHRHEQATGLGNILFSVASITKPGTFDLQNMGAFFCPGLSLFMTLNNVKDPFHAFDIMLETCNQLQEDLGGVILDEERNPLTRNKIFELRKFIREYEENKRTADLFADDLIEVK